MFANLSYEYYHKKINFYSPFNPENKISHHFQLKNALPKNFTKNFILIGKKSYIDYLQNNKKITLLGSKSFPFTKEKLEIYEVIID